MEILQAPRGTKRVFRASIGNNKVLQALRGIKQVFWAPAGNRQVFRAPTGHRQAFRAPIGNKQVLWAPSDNEQVLRAPRGNKANLGDTGIIPSLPITMNSPALAQSCLHEARLVGRSTAIGISVQSPQLRECTCSSTASHSLLLAPPPVHGANMTATVTMLAEPNKPDCNRPQHQKWIPGQGHCQ